MLHVYCKPNCVYCDKAKQFLQEKHVQFECTTLDPEDASYVAARDDLISRCQVDHRTFPFIFVGSTFVGGYTDLVVAADSGRLAELGVQIENDF